MDLVVQTREKFGKAVKSLRRDGFVPAELYGCGIGNLHLSVGAREFTKVFKEAGTNTVLNLLVDKEKRPAIIHDVAHDYLTGEVTHVDFYQVRMDEKITAKIPLEFLGEASAVKEKGGVLNRSLSEVEVEALPKDLPHRLSINLAPLDDLNKSIYVKDIDMPPGVRVLVGDETVVATVTPPRAEEKIEAPVEVGEVKVETEEKKAEREAGKAEGGEVKGAEVKETEVKEPAKGRDVTKS